MDSINRDLALAIRLTKILSGKEEATSNYTQAFFDELKTGLQSELAPQLLTKGLYFMHRVSVKNYTHLLPQQQEYALWVAIALLQKLPSHGAVQAKAFGLSLRTLSNLTLYLQHKELVTPSEVESFKNCEGLLLQLFSYFHIGTPFCAVHCPEHCEKDFSAFFMPVAIPEDFTVVDSTQDLFAEENMQKTAFAYTLETIEDSGAPSELAFRLLEILVQRRVAPYSQHFAGLFRGFKKWAEKAGEHPSALRLCILLGELSSVPGVQEEITSYLCRWLVFNDSHYVRHGVDYVPEEPLAALCQLLVQGLQPAADSTCLPALDIPGFGRSSYTEEGPPAGETCTYNRTGPQFQPQHWYYCYTCRLTENKGVCSVCAIRCHTGHEVVYSRRGNFFCDCGNEQGPRTCKCMPRGRKHRGLRLEKEDSLGIFRIPPHIDIDDFISDRPPRLQDIYLSSSLSSPHYSPSPRIIHIEEMDQEFSGSPILNLQGDDVHSSDEDSDEDKKPFEEEDEEDAESPIEEAAFEEERSVFSSDSSDEERGPVAMSAAPSPREAEGRALHNLVLRTLARVQSGPPPAANLRVEASTASAWQVCCFKTLLSQHKPSGSDQKACREIAGRHPNARRTLAHSPVHMLVLVAEHYQLLCADAALFYCGGADADKATLTVLSKVLFPFFILSVKFNPFNPRVAALAGPYQVACVQLATKQNRGTVEKKVAVNLGDRTPIVKIEWVPGESSRLAVCTTLELRVFDFSQDVLVPFFVCSSFEHDLTDMVVLGTHILAGTKNGYIYRQPILEAEDSLFLSETLSFPERLAAHCKKVVSLDYVPEGNLLFAHFADAKLLVSDADNLERAVMIDLNDPSIRLSGGACQFTRLSDTTYLAISRTNSATALLLQVTDNKIQVSPFKDIPKNIDGFCTYSKQGKHLMLVQHDDGTLATYSISTNSQGDQWRNKIDSPALNAWLTLDKLPSTVEMPRTFFEKCIALTTGRSFAGFNKSEITLGGDIAAYFVNSRLALEKLSFEKNSSHAGISSTYLPNRKRLALTATLEGSSFNSLLFAGFKVHVDAGSKGFIEVLNRKIALQSGKRWYDVALCDIEILKCLLMKELRFALVSEAAYEQPITLYHLELFAVNQHDFGLESKLCELYKGSQGCLLGQGRVSLYKGSSWQQKFQLLSELPLPEKHLVVFLNALAAVLPENEAPRIAKVLAFLAQRGFSGGEQLLPIALRQAVKKLVCAMKSQESYLGIKALLVSSALATGELRETGTVKLVKCLSHLLRLNVLLFGKVVNWYPDFLQRLDRALSLQAKQACLDEFFKVLLGSVQYKAILCGSSEHVLQELYSFAPDIAKPELEMAVSLLDCPVSAFKANVVGKLYQCVKKKTKAWFRQASSHQVLAMEINDYFLPQGASPSECVEAVLLNYSPISVCANPPDFCYLLLHYLLADWPIEPHRADARLLLVSQLLHYLEQVWVKHSVQDTRYFALMASALETALQLDFTGQNEHQNQSKALLLHLVVQITSYFRPRDDKYARSKKLDRDMVYGLVTYIYRHSRDSLYSALLHGYDRFYKQAGSVKAIYRDGFFIENESAREPSELLKPENPLLATALEAAFPPEVFEMETDQFLLTSIIELNINLVAGLQAEGVAPKTELSVLLGLSFEEEIAEPTVSDNDWIDLLLKVLLEPSLEFLWGPTQVLLSLLMPNYSSVHSFSMAEIHFTTIQDVAERSNSFRSLEYFNVIQVLKILFEIEKHLGKVEGSWDVLFKIIAQEKRGVDHLVSIALHLGGETACKALEVLTSLVRTSDEGSYLHSWLLSSFLPNSLHKLFSVLPIYTQSNYPKALGQLITELSNISSGDLAKQLLSGLVSHLVHLPRLGLDSALLMQNIDKLTQQLPEEESISPELQRVLQTSFGVLDQNTNAEIYEVLHKLFHPKDYCLYILEPEPCLNCYSKTEHSRPDYKLNDISAEVRFSEDSYFIRLKEFFKLSKVQIELSEVRGHKAIKGCSLYYCNSQMIPLAELKTSVAHWTKLKTLKFKAGSTSRIDLELEIPVVIFNLRIEFLTINIIRNNPEEGVMHSRNYIGSRSRYPLTNRQDARGSIVGISLGNEREIINCHRCNKHLEDNMGSCLCGENAFQCLYCRNMNFNQLDAFICIECGESKYCKLNLSIKGCPDAQYEKLNSSAGVDEAHMNIESGLETIQYYFENLPKWRDSLSSLCGQLNAHSAKLTENSSDNFSPVLHSVNKTFKECRAAYDEMMIGVKTVTFLRQAIMDFQGTEISMDLQSEQSLCYGCNFYFLRDVLKFLAGESALVSSLTEDMLNALMLFYLRTHDQTIRKHCRKALVRLMGRNLSGAQRALQTIREHIEAVLQWESHNITSIRNCVSLVLAFTRAVCDKYFLNSDEESVGIWESALRHFWGLFRLLYTKSTQNSLLAEQLAGFLEVMIEVLAKQKVLTNTSAFFLDNPALIRSDKTPGRIPYTCPAFLSTWLAGECSFYDWLKQTPGDCEIPDNWLFECLIYSPSSNVQELCKLLLLALANSGLSQQILGICMQKLEEALRVCKQGTDAFFALLTKLFSKHMTSEVFALLFNSVENTVQELIRLEASARVVGLTTVNISIGHGLEALLTMILNSTNDDWSKDQLRTSKFLVNCIIQAFLNIRKLELVKNKVIIESQELLEKLIDRLHIECSVSQKAIFLEECIKAFLTCDNLKSKSILLQQMLKIICPPQEEPVYSICLEKISSQEDYIRRNIEKDIFTTKELGPLMADVRLKIAKEVDISEVDLLELIVNERIISPQLKVTDVYEHVVWPKLQMEDSRFQGKLPSDFSCADLPPMVVIFRLAGIDGEATEDRVDSLPTMQVEEVNLEEKYAITAVISTTSMMQTCLEILASHSQLAPEILVLLNYACQIKLNRHKLCETGGIEVLFKALKEASEKTFSGLLSMVSLLANDEESQSSIAQYPEGVPIMLDTLMKNPNAISTDVLTAIPYICNGNPEACNCLVSFFESEVNPDVLGSDQSPRLLSMLENLVTILDSLPASHKTLKESFLSSGFTAKIISVFSSGNLEPALLVSVLKILKGLLSAYVPAQQLLQSETVEAIFKLQKSSQDIGTAAESLIESILRHCEESFHAVADMLQLLQNQDKEQKRLKAGELQQELIKQYTENLSLFELPNEEPGLSCVICKEGYTLRPDDILGFYVYCSRVSVDASIDNPEGGGGAPASIMSMVTHFNTVHNACHRQATKAEKNMRKPKSEWEGARIRNQHTKCNNWFPIKGPCVSKEEYEFSIDKMFCSYDLYSNRVKHTLHDLRILIHRLCWEESFSKDSKGGGPEHNMHAVPYMIQLLRTVSKLYANETTHYKGVLEKFLSKLNEVSPDQFLFTLTLALVYVNKPRWNAIRESFVSAAKHAAKRSTGAKGKAIPISNEQSVDQKLQEVAGTVRNLLIATKLTDLIFNVLYEDISEPWEELVDQFLESAEPVIQERMVSIYEAHKKHLAMPTLETLVNLLDFQSYITGSIEEWINN